MKRKDNSKELRQLANEQAYIGSILATLRNLYRERDGDHVEQQAIAIVGKRLTTKRVKLLAREAELKQRA